MQQVPHLSNYEVTLCLEPILAMRYVVLPVSRYVLSVFSRQETV